MKRHFHINLDCGGTVAVAVSRAQQQKVRGWLSITGLLPPKEFLQALHELGYMREKHRS
jgi:hypothetical protein